MTMKTTRSLERGINLLKIMAQCGPLSLAEFHKISGVSKSTLRRLLFTLIETGIVRQSLVDAKYRINIYWAAGTNKEYLPDIPLFVDIAIARLTELTKKIGWTCGIHMISGGKMQILDNTRVHSPFHTFQAQSDFELNMFASSTGISCLAEFDDEEIIRRASEVPTDSKFSYRRVSPSIRDYLVKVNRVRELGYGFRQLAYSGPPLLDDLEAIALPMRHRDRVFGGIAIAFPLKLMSHEDFAEKYLGDLTAAVSDIDATYTVMSD